MRLIRPGLWSFGQQLRWFVILPTILAVLLLTATIISEEELEIRAKHRAEDRTEQLALRVENFFRRANILTRAIASHQKSLGRTPDDRTMAFLRDLLQATPLREAQGVYIAFEDRDDRQENVIQWVDRIKMGKASRLDYDFHNASDEQCEWYWAAKAKTENEVAVSRPYFDKGGANIAMVSVTRSIYDKNGAFVGVAGVDLDMTELIFQVQHFVALNPEKPEDLGRSEAYLVSQDGRVFAHPDQERLQVRGGELPYLHLSERTEGPQVADKPKDNFVRIRPRSGESHAGEWRRFSWQECDIPGWKVVLSTPDASLFTKLTTPLRAIGQNSIGIGLLFLTLIVIVSVVANWVTGPITRLTAAAAAVEAGDYRPESLVAGLAERRDEFGQLARGFRRMVEEVSGREQQLRKAQDDLSHREQHYRALIENATDLITIVGQDGVIQYKSPSVQRILGYTTEELLGRSGYEFIHPDDRVTVRECARRLVDHPGSHIQIEYRFRHKDGSWRILESQCSVLIGDPAVNGVIVNSRDITERKRDETEILQLNARLEERVRRRTAELEQKNEELQGAKEATEQAMKQQEIFLSNVAHDLRTPLTIVIGYSEDLLRRAKKKGNEAFIPDLRLIANRGKELLELINDLLNLSKAMNDKGIELDLEEFDVAEMVRGHMEGIGTIAQKYGNTIEFHPEPGLGTMVADKVKVWRLLMNLLSNACKFTKDGTITTTASRVHDDQGEWIRFRVADTGIGMSPEMQTHLFHRFSQVHASSGKLQAGVGLGLSICMVYCKAMGGRIVVESQEGRGSTFTVTLPVEVRPTLPASLATGPPASLPARASAQSVPAAANAFSTSPGDDANLILIIDDDASVCRLMERNLDEEGLRSRIAHDGAEGLQMARQLHPSAIILDVVMSGLDGWNVLAALKSDAATAQIPVIMVSMLDERERGLRMGADEYIMKPFGRDRLTDLLHKHLGDRPGARLLVVEDDVETREQVCRSLRQQDWEVYPAGDGFEALRLLREHRPDLILLDLMLPVMHGFELIEEVRKDPESQSIPIVVMTAADLSAEDRQHLEGQVKQILHKGLYGRDELLREIRTLVNQQQRRKSTTVQEKVHGQDPLH
jgi:PAS domain S-box-containing protein